MCLQFIEFIQAASLVKYIHFADSNRMAPGSGHIDFDEILGALSVIGYDEWISVEILLIPNPDKAARDAADFLLRKIKNT